MVAHKFLEVLDQKNSLLGALRGWEALIDKGAELLAEELSRGSTLALLAPEGWEGLAHFVADLLRRRLSLADEAVTCGPEVAEGAVALLLCPQRPDDAFLSRVTALGEKGHAMLVFCGAERGLVGGLGHWCAEVPLTDPSATAQAIAWLVDALAADALCCEQ